MFRILTTVLLIIAAPLAAETRVPEKQMEIQLGFAPLVKQATPAVVNIYAKRIVQARQSPFQNDPFFRGLFRDFGEVRPQVQNSLGSGVILSEDGYVVSNYHVVGDAAEIRVVLNDRREFDAEVMLADEDSDLAILKLDGAADMPFLNLRDSDGVEVGELVLAIGNPFGVGQTVSSGIVSGLARSGTATGNGRGYFIQTDAPINPGNSGGALIDVNGQLIGVNTSILTRSGGSNGIGFAIPSNLVAQFVAQARQGHERFQRPWAGMNGQPVDADIAASLGLDRPGGIVVSGLQKVSPFLEAGIEPGDVIVAVDGQPVNTPAEMIFRMSVAGLGEEVTVTAVRNGKSFDTPVRLLAAPEKPQRDRRQMGKSTALPGLQVVNINPAVLAEYGLPLGSTGVVVEDPGPFGGQVGLRKGDILHVINGETVETTDDVQQVLSGRVRVLAFDVQRGLQRLVIRFRL
ncbi:Do family serine endopeptidase [Thalassovita aquimarina]|uniref:Do family serine endopeptidase n=1 Tax=Thalassovita aquimarina TaxID=2785917 RepID=A0ABS5HPS6_9RHOB|nr:Do family serine endopeptidase [Thalassovita aquimarina]MBR9650827.1 Do family serine endopeptidase [Thalassovita aquimarina]